MLILALDTSGDTCSIALTEGRTTLAVYSFRHERRLSERLNGLIEMLLADTERTLKQIEAVAVGLGPGSFTGVRVGVTFAKTFALVRELPLVGVSSLSALVEPLAGVTALPLVAITPTRRTESVAAFYLPGSVEPIAPPQVYANSEIVTLARLQSRQDDVLLVGEIAQSIAEANPDVPARALYAYPTADAVARLATNRLTQGQSDSIDELVPLYVTPTPVG